MNICFKCKQIEISTKNFGNIEITIDRKNKIGNGYLISTTINNKTISGFIDSDYNEIIELDERELVEEFHTKDKKDICLKYKIKDEDILECYHICINNKKPEIAHVVGPYSDEKYEIINSDDNNYWLFKKVNNNFEEYAAYDIKKQKQITSYLDIIEFMNENDFLYHAIYFQKTVKSDIVYEEIEDKDYVIHTYICGFLDSEGNFSSDILDQEKEMYCSRENIGRNTLSPAFDKFICNLQKEYLKEYQEKENRIDKYINYLAVNPNVFKKKEKKNRKVKIVNFNDRKNV